MAPKKGPPSLDEDVRTLFIPAPGQRGVLSPSKHSFLPTLQEQVGKERRAVQRVERAAAMEEEEEERDAPQRDERVDSILVHMDAPTLDWVKRQVLARNDAIQLDAFMSVMLGVLPECDGEERVAQAAQCAALFRQMDVDGEEFLSWEVISNFLIEQGMRGGDESTVDNIKRYESSPTMDQTQHDDSVEKLRYFEEVDTLVVLTYNSRKFKVFDPRKCAERQEAIGHRGSVIDCCYINTYNQYASVGADSSICLWDAKPQQRNQEWRNISLLPTKDVQRSVQWSDTANKLFTGSMDGTLSVWDLEQMALVESRRGGAALRTGGTSAGHKDAVNELLQISEIDLLASGSSDAAVLMWDCETIKPKKTLRGHKKGVYSLAYSPDYHCLLSAGLDQDALVWNPCVEHVPIFRLKGHAHALAGVAVVPGTPQILTADVAGTFRLWDMRNFRCVQAFGGTEQLQDLNTFCTMPPHKRLAAGSSKISLYDYMEEWGSENVTDPGGVTAALYNRDLQQFYTASKRSLKVWDSRAGLQTVLRDVVRSEITAVAFADKGRKLYVGDARGEVSAHSLLSGAKLRGFESHETDVSCLEPFGQRLISAAWDGTVKVHLDEKQPLVKGRFCEHSDGITCLAVCPGLELLASGGVDAQVVIYALKSGKVEQTLWKRSGKRRTKDGERPKDVIVAAVEWINVGSDLLAAALGSEVQLWGRQADLAWHCVLKFDQNLAKEQIHGALTSLGVAPSEPWLITADSKGTVRCWDVSKATESKTNSKGVFLTSVDPRRGGDAELMSTAQVSKEAVSSLVVIESPPCVLAVAQDRRVTVWSLPDLSSCGALLQQRDPHFHLDLDTEGRKAAALDEARGILDRVTVLPMPPPALREPERLARPEKDSWLDMLPPSLQQSFFDASDPEYEEAFGLFLREMSRSKEERGDLRLARKAQEAQAAKVRQRRHPLSAAEAKCARRLARAMVNVGDHGTYARMAASIEPR